MASSAQLRAQAKYDNHNTKQIMLKLNITSDADVLAKLDASDNRQGYIKTLIRNDMKNVSVLSVEAIKYLLLPVVKKYNIRSLSLFGSYARNEATVSSDVDILIDGGNYQGLIGYMEMINAMKSALGRDVDVITQSSLDESKLSSDITFRNNIERDKVVLI